MVAGGVCKWQSVHTTVASSRVTQRPGHLGAHGWISISVSASASGITCLHGQVVGTAVGEALGFLSGVSGLWGAGDGILVQTTGFTIKSTNCRTPKPSAEEYYSVFRCRVKVAASHCKGDSFVQYLGLGERMYCYITIWCKALALLIRGRFTSRWGFDDLLQLQIMQTLGIMTSEENFY